MLYRWRYTVDTLWDGADSQWFVYDDDHDLWHWDSLPPWVQGLYDFANDADREEK